MFDQYLIQVQSGILIRYSKLILLCVLRIMLVSISLCSVRSPLKRNLKARIFISLLKEQPLVLPIIESWSEQKTIPLPNEAQTERGGKLTELLPFVFEKL
jgi:hypothetical protein